MNPRVWGRIKMTSRILKHFLATPTNVVHVYAFRRLICYYSVDVLTYPQIWNLKSITANMGSRNRAWPVSDTDNEAANQAISRQTTKPIMRPLLLNPRVHEFLLGLVIEPGQFPIPITRPLTRQYRGKQRNQ